MFHLGLIITFTQFLRDINNTQFTASAGTGSYVFMCNWQV